VTQLVEARRHSPEGRGFDFPIDLILRPHYDPGIDSASNINDEKEYILWGKGGQYVGLTTLPPSCADPREILEASNSWSPKCLSKSVQGLLYRTFNSY